MTCICLADTYMLGARALDARETQFQYWSTPDPRTLSLYENAASNCRTCLLVRARDMSSDKLLQQGGTLVLKRQRCGDPKFQFQETYMQGSLTRTSCNCSIPGSSIEEQRRFTRNARRCGVFVQSMAETADKLETGNPENTWSLYFCYIRYVIMRPA